MRFILCVAFLLELLAEPVLSRLQVRLTNSKEPHMGKIEVFYKKKWGDICDHGWDLKGAQVVCRMLGYPGAIRYTFGDWFGRGSGDFWLDEVKCSGEENSIEICSHKDWGKVNSLCRSQSVAGVVCRKRDDEIIFKPVPSRASKNVIDLPVKLLGPTVNDHITKGVLQVKHRNRWGYVCRTNWIRENARVACGMLGFKDALPSQEIPPTKQRSRNTDFLMSDVQCKGEESSLVECSHAGWGPLQCAEDPVYISCVPYKAILQPDRVRLRSGAQLWEGRVEVRYRWDQMDHWGSVCDDQFDMVDGNVVCRTLGFGTVSRVYHNAWYGQNSEKVYMDDLECTGKEDNFMQCRHTKRVNCDHFEDVGVKCNGPKLYNHKIRLSGGYNPAEGRVEVFMNEEWGTVCADTWGLDETIVVCRQLNRGFGKEAIITSIFGITSLPFAVMNVKCKGNERSLYHCKMKRQGNCKTGIASGVICIDRLPDLVVNVKKLGDNTEYRMEQIELSNLECAYEENCLTTSSKRSWNRKHKGHRSLLRFTGRIENRGLTHFRPHMDKSQWQWHQCHLHYHSMEVFSLYDLIGIDGSRVAEGHKASFCLEDTECDAGIEKKWNCTGGADQGVSPNCYDVYKWNIDCQWIDTTDLGYRAGKFQLRITVNPNRTVAESDYSNNVGICDAFYYGTFVLLMNCHIENCESKVRTYGGTGFGGCCFFPFTVNGVEYTSCKKLGRDRPWCATTRNYRRDNRWGYCT